MRHRIVLQIEACPVGLPYVIQIYASHPTARHCLLRVSRCTFTHSQRHSQQGKIKSHCVTRAQAAILGTSPFHGLLAGDIPTSLNTRATAPEQESSPARMCLLPCPTSPPQLPMSTCVGLGYRPHDTTILSQRHLLSTLKDRLSPNRTSVPASTERDLVFIRVYWALS